MFTIEDAEQRGLSRPVPANDRHTLAGFHLKENIVEQREMSVGNRDPFECNQRHVS